MEVSHGSQELIISLFKLRGIPHLPESIEVTQKHYMLKPIQPSTHLKLWLPLLLVAPASSLGMIAIKLAPGIIGSSIFVVCSLWMHSIPLIWTIVVDRQPLHFTPPKRRDWLVGVFLGVLLAGTILGLYGVASHWIDLTDVRDRVASKVGDLSLTTFLAGAGFIVLINTLLEEYVWRWFVFRKCAAWQPGILAIVLSALLFTSHHVIELATYFNDGRVVLLGSLAVLAAGMIWSRCYQVYRSIWIGYISHALASAAIVTVAWHLLFGNRVL